MMNYGFNFTKEENVLFKGAVKLAEEVFNLEIPKHYKDWEMQHLFAINQTFEKIISENERRGIRNKHFETMYVKVQNEILFKFIRMFPPMPKDVYLKSVDNVLEQNLGLKKAIYKIYEKNTQKNKE